MIAIRATAPADHDAVWHLVEPLIRAGEVFALPRDMRRDAAIAYWCGPDRASFVAERDSRVVGTYYLRANQAVGGDHVANAGYASAERGVGRAMAEHSLVEARNRGFRAMQFNFVVASNARAVALWESLGFAVMGRLPEAFRHPTLGLVDALVMHRAL